MNLFKYNTAKLTMMLIAFSTTAFAQPKTNAFQNTLTTSYTSVRAVKNKQDKKEITTANGKMMAPLQQAIEGMSVSTKRELANAAGESDVMIKDLQQKYPAKKSPSDMITDLGLAPFPITVLTVAGKSDIEAIYKPYYDKLEKKKEEITAIAKRNNKYQEVYDKEGTAGLEKRAAAEAEKNALVREMGGAEKLKNMTEVERTAAAEEMKRKIQQNPAMLTGNAVGDPGMKSMQQKLMSDPEYAKRFSKMSEDEKQAEMKKFMTIKPQQKDPNAVYASQPKSKNHIDTEKSIEISLLLERTAKRLEEATATYSRMTTSTNNLVEDMKKQLADWAETTTKNIPIVELGEYGHDRDPDMMQAMELTRKAAYYTIEQQEITLKANCWKQHKDAVAAALLEFNAFAATYQWGQGDENQLFNGTYTDPKMINALSAYYAIVESTLKESEKLSKHAKSAQNSFDKVL